MMNLLLSPKYISNFSLLLFILDLFQHFRRVKTEPIFQWNYYQSKNMLATIPN